MTKSKRALRSKPTEQRRRPLKPKSEPRPTVSEAQALKNTKQEQVLHLLRRTEGATISAIMTATGWQHHSVRGFLAGVVRKRLGFGLESERNHTGRVYRIVPGNSSQRN